MAYLSVLVLGSILSLGEAAFPSTHVQSLVHLNDVLQDLGNVADAFSQKNQKVSQKNDNLFRKQLSALFIEVWKFVKVLIPNEDVLKAVSDTAAYFLNKKMIFSSNFLRIVGDTMEIVLSFVDSGSELDGSYLRHILQSVADMFDRMSQNHKKVGSIEDLVNVFRYIMNSLPLINEDIKKILDIFADLLNILGLLCGELNFKDNLQDASIALREIVSRYNDSQDFLFFADLLDFFSHNYDRNFKDILQDASNALREIFSRYSDSQDVLFFAGLLDSFSRNYDSLKFFFQSLSPLISKFLQSVIPKFLYVYMKLFTLIIKEATKEAIKQLSVPKEEVMAGFTLH